MLLGSLVLSTICVGCASFKRPLIHPLPDDFKLVAEGETFTAPKQGAFVSDYFMEKVMAVDVEAPKDDQ